MLLLSFGALTPDAQADELPPPYFSVSHPVDPDLVQSLEVVAQSYWGERSVTLPGPVEVFLIANTEVGGAFGEQPGRRVWLTPRLLRTRGVVNRAHLCMTFLHERGHNAGLAHESGDPIMVTEPLDGRIPPKCVTWAYTGYGSAPRGG